MKDINNEVKALEIALEVATNIQGQSYAYAVTRIQQALLEEIVRYTNTPNYLRETHEPT